MQEYVIVGLTALTASALSFFSGFGLGTVLMPIFAAFFPVPVAVSMTAIVHFSNNLFKLYLTGRHASFKITLLFGAPAILAAFFGAQILFWIADKNFPVHYVLFGHPVTVPLIKLMMAVLITVFAVTEVIPFMERIPFSPKFLPLGGLLSGFFGGLSGHQGVFRSVFLIRCALTKESFIATNVVIACLVDLSRLTIYGRHLLSGEILGGFPVLITAILCAFLGSWYGNRYLKKITVRAIQSLVAFFLFLIATCLALGLI